MGRLFDRLAGCRFTNTMIGLILSAGKGTRLRPLTFLKPKPMVRVAGRPVLEHLANHLHSYGINKIIVNTHYKPKVIQRYFGERFLYTHEPTLLGEIDTIDSLKHWLKKEYTVVMNGDTLTNIDINQMMRLSGGSSVMSMDGKIYTGTKILSPDYFRGNRKFFKYESADTWWYDIGTFNGLRKARKFYEKKSSHLPKL